MERSIPPDLVDVAQQRFCFSNSSYWFIVNVHKILPAAGVISLVYSCCLSVSTTYSRLRPTQTLFSKILARYASQAQSLKTVNTVVQRLATGRREDLTNKSKTTHATSQIVIAGLGYCCLLSSPKTKTIMTRPRFKHNFQIQSDNVPILH